MDRRIEMNEKEWSETVSFYVDNALNWELHKETLRKALVNVAGLNVKIPNEYRDTWGGLVTRDSDRFIVNLYPDAATMGE